ncbi:MAG: NifU family protein [Bdellovibrionales bacterium]|jgi:Fe-S cluster biogenesis protein NfuA|nr:NifU family protein [Bdellovibrionales bacterium]MBT3526861.1 NifU family protein [Bdellovibrionales bacterium]MBT7668426.1 NifU family protein [Bdellovibrionales bacterium]MBT7767601.1 NifU family protein [Bdellovibrionales bacterium]
MIRKIEALLKEEVVPALEAHGGSIEVVDVDNNKVYVKMTGGCHGCAGARATLKDGVERIIKERFPMIEEVVDTTDHQTGQNPYMS